MDQLLNELRHRYKNISFQEGRTFCWSPETQVVTYVQKYSLPSGLWSLLHETSHALLSHSSYSTDFELLNIEMQAWEYARELGASMGIMIDEDHIQDCLDSYRDWLYGRSICPTCGNKSLQDGDTKRYACFNCHTAWRVTHSRFCRTYRASKPYARKAAPFQTS